MQKILGAPADRIKGHRFAWLLMGVAALFTIASVSEKSGWAVEMNPAFDTDLKAVSQDPVHYRVLVDMNKAMVVHFEGSPRDPGTLSIAYFRTTKEIQALKTAAQKNQTLKEIPELDIANSDPNGLQSAAKLLGILYVSPIPRKSTLAGRDPLARNRKNTLASKSKIAVPVKAAPGTPPPQQPEAVTAPGVSSGD